MVMLNRLQSTKAPRISMNMLIFVCILVTTVTVDSSGSYILRAFDSLQPKLLVGLMISALLPNGPKIRDRQDRKLVTIGLTKLATECPELLSSDPEYSSLFTSLIATIITMLTTLPAGGLGEMSTAEGEGTGEEEPSGTFWKLRITAAPRRCPTIDELPDATSVFINSLVALSRLQPSGKIVTLLSSLDQPNQSSLSNLLNQSNVSL